MARAAGTERDRLDIYKRRSSAQRETFNLMLFLNMLVILGLEQSAIDRGSMAIANNKGLKGQSCSLVE